MTKSTTINVRMPATLAEEIKDQAWRERKSMSKYLRDLHVEHTRAVKRKPAKTPT